MKIIDTHVHLDLKQFRKDLDGVINRAKEKGVDKFIIPGIAANDMDRLVNIAEEYPEVYFASGNHPNYTAAFNIEEIEKYAAHEKCVAIGECGLDWFRIKKGENINEVKKRQIDIFTQQIELSSKWDKPLILHSRDTDDDMVNTLLNHKDILVGGVIHCYVGSEKLLELLDHGFYFGIGGIVTYKSAVELRENVKKIPLDRLLIETDAPYLTPRQFKGKRNEPGYTPAILKELSIILNIDEKKLSEIIYENTLRLFKFK